MAKDRYLRMATKQGIRYGTKRARITRTLSPRVVSFRKSRAKSSAMHSVSGQGMVPER